MIETAKAIIHTIEPGLRKYQAIMTNFNAVDVSSDAEFQRKFNGFYKVRQRNQSFYNTYYSLMERSKGQPIGFRDILEQLYNDLGRLEPSFSSKLIATINPDMPI